ncbi:hypothetical protein [Croceibacterium ferulae]|uniref:hypothetical protein n=1 Tax=Croceibacterium ferulae TaxID=1854641 RepID=UPI000F882F29|nr:hypothetical protein [Croceibacterium ferulae]
MAYACDEPEADEPLVRTASASPCSRAGLVLAATLAQSLAFADGGSRNAGARRMFERNVFFLRSDQERRAGGDPS